MTGKEASNRQGTHRLAAFSIGASWLAVLLGIVLVFAVGNAFALPLAFWVVTAFCVTMFWVVRLRVS